jgi:hypothetical protein
MGARRRLRRRGRRKPHRHRYLPAQPRSADPLLRRILDVCRLKLAPAVIADIEASRARFLRYYQPRLFAFSWHLYDTYLRANRVAGGVASYSRFVRIMVGTPFDAEGLPLAAGSPNPKG